MNIKTHDRFKQTGHLGGWYCPIWVADIHGECRIRPRLWGYLTFWAVSRYFQIFGDDGFPILIKDRG